MYFTLTVTLSVLCSHKGLADCQWAARSKVTKSPGDVWWTTLDPPWLVLSVL